MRYIACDSDNAVHCCTKAVAAGGRAWSGQNNWQVQHSCGMACSGQIHIMEWLQPSLTCGVMQVVATLIGVVIIDRIGRRAVLIQASIQAIMLCCAVLCCAVLCCSMLSCALLCYGASCYAVLCHAILCSLAYDGVGRTNAISMSVQLYLNSQRFASGRL